MDLCLEIAANNDHIVYNNTKIKTISLSRSVDYLCMNYIIRHDLCSPSRETPISRS